MERDTGHYHYGRWKRDGYRSDTERTIDGDNCDGDNIDGTWKDPKRGRQPKKSCGERSDKVTDVTAMTVTGTPEAAKMKRSLRW